MRDTDHCMVVDVDRSPGLVARLIQDYKDRLYRRVKVGELCGSDPIPILTFLETFLHVRWLESGVLQSQELP